MGRFFLRRAQRRPVRIQSFCRWYLRRLYCGYIAHAGGIPFLWWWPVGHTWRRRGLSDHHFLLSTYHKPLNMYDYVPGNSSHPVHTKQSLIRTDMVRLLRTNSHDASFCYHRNFFLDSSKHERLQMNTPSVPNVASLTRQKTKTEPKQKTRSLWAYVHGWCWRSRYLKRCPQTILAACWKATPITLRHVLSHGQIFVSASLQPIHLTSMTCNLLIVWWWWWLVKNKIVFRPKLVEHFD